MGKLPAPPLQSTLQLELEMTSPRQSPSSPKVWTGNRENTTPAQPLHPLLHSQKKPINIIEKVKNPKIKVDKKKKIQACLWMLNSVYL